MSTEMPAGAAGDSTRDPPNPAGADAADTGRPGRLPAPRSARLLTVTVFGLLGAQAVLHFFGAGPHPPRDIAVFLAYLTALLGIQLLYFGSRRTRLHSPRSVAVLLVEACLVYLPIVQFKFNWIGLPGSFFAGSLLLVLPAPLAVVGFIAATASVGFTVAQLGGSGYDDGYAMIATVGTGLIVYGLSRLATLVAELPGARTESAKLAVAQERLRFARDLHDLLGYSLSAIMLKSELTHRLVGRNVLRAEQELAEILVICRQALADVRTVASGYRELSLEAECGSARAVLAAADIEARSELDYRDLPARVRTALATVLREGVTNVLRHSDARHCDIRVQQSGGEVRIDLTNDGVPPSAAPPERLGSGLHNLALRVAALDGTLLAGGAGEGQFRLQATIPVPPPAAAPRRRFPGTSKPGRAGAGPARSARAS